MRKFLAILALVVLLGSASCSCTLERQALEQLEKNHEHIFSRYVGYVGRDPALSDEAKASEVKIVEVTKRMVERLKKRTE